MARMLVRATFPALAFVAVVACGGQTASPGGGSSSTSSTETSGSSGGSSSGEGGCGWPADLNPPDGGPGWSVAKFYLQCDVGDDYENCLSNDPDECPDDGAGVAGGAEGARYRPQAHPERGLQE